MCLNATGNTSSSAGSFVPPPNGNGAFDAVGLSVVLNISTTTFKIQGYSGSGTNDAAVESFLQGSNTLSGTGGGAFAQHNVTGFTPLPSGTCTTPPTGPARDLAAGRVTTNAKHGAGHARKTRQPVRKVRHPRGSHRQSRAHRHRDASAPLVATPAHRLAAAHRIRAILNAWRPAWMRHHR